MNRVALLVRTTQRFHRRHPYGRSRTQCSTVPPALRQGNAGRGCPPREVERAVSRTRASHAGQPLAAVHQALAEALGDEGGATPGRTRRGSIRLSEGELHRLPHWLNEAEQRLGSFRWYAEEPADVSPYAHRFAVEFINGLIDKDVPKPPGPH